MFKWVDDVHGLKIVPTERRCSVWTCDMCKNTETIIEDPADRWAIHDLPRGWGKVGSEQGHTDVCYRCMDEINILIKGRENG